MAVDRVRINGIAHSWGSCKLKIAGERVAGVLSISYSDKLETAFGYGMTRAHGPRSQSRGKYSAEPISMKVTKSTAQEIREMLARRGDGISYGIVMVPIVLQYLEPDDKPITVEFEDCRLVENSASDEEGFDELSEELKWTTFGIRRNGLALYEGSNS